MSTTILMCGSFDPPHEGHQIIIESSLREFRADLGVIIPNDNNQWKPSMMSRSHRITMLHLLFQGNSKVKIWEDTKQTAFQEYLSKQRTIFLIGADTWDHYKNKIPEAFSQIVVVSRPGYPHLDEKVIGGIPIRYFLLDYPEISSTRIRTSLQDHFEMPPHLDINVYRYIRDHGLYSLSGDSYSIIENTFVKTFSSPERMQREIEGTRMIRSISLRLSSCPEIKRVTDLSIGYTLIQGNPLSYYLRENIEVYEKCRQIGAALSELHSMTSSVSDPTNLQEWTISLLSKANNITQDEGIIRRLRFLVDRYHQNPESMSYTHGDANSGNFLFSSDRVIMVDLGSTRSKGYPGYEIYQFLSSLRQRRYAFSPEVIEEAKQGFWFGYTREITPEAHELYRYYWNLRSGSISKL